MSGPVPRPWVPDVSERLVRQVTEQVRGASVDDVADEIERLVEHDSTTVSAST